MQKLSSALGILPHKSGVYHFFDNNGLLLYIGKAKDLKKRIKSYFKIISGNIYPASNLSIRVANMARLSSYVKYIITDSENDALVLENSLIKQLKPKYNILLRDDKTFPYIYVNLNENFPRFDITRKIIKNKNIKYFGPFCSASKDILNAIYHNFKLAQKKSCLKGKKACLFFQIDRCYAPCEGKISSNDYHLMIKDAISFLNNKNAIIKFLKNKMQEFSATLRFEEALECKNSVQRIQKAYVKIDVDLAKKEDIDVFVLKSHDKRAVIMKLFIRDGKIASSFHNAFRANEGFSSKEALRISIFNHYNRNRLLPPNRILLAENIDDKDLLQDFLQSTFGKKIPLEIPKSGSKKHIINLAINNVQEILSSELRNNEDLLQDIKDLLNLQNFPETIEIFDTSHIGGTNAIGAMVVYQDNQFTKNSFRIYNLSSKDEYSQQKEMLKRRINSFDKDSPPDLWIIDGGVGQLNLAKELLDSSGVYIDIIAISKEKIDTKASRSTNRSKGRAKDILHTDGLKISLNPNDKRLHFVQKLRDEVHRFALKNHRSLKSKSDKQINLLKAKGIGDAKLKKLLSYFGSFEKIYGAHIDEISSVLNTNDAKAIKGLC